MKLGAFLGIIVLCIAALIGTYVATRQPGVTAAPTPAKSPDGRPEGAPEISKTGPHPKAVVDETSVEFGSMGVNEIRKHKFVVTNKGEAPLRLKVGTPTCKCTVGKLEKDTVPPGEKVEIELTWQPKEVQMDFHQRAPIYTNDPENQEIRLAIQGNVVPLVNIEPSGEWEIGILTDDRPVALSGTILSHIREKFQVESVESSNPLLTAEVEPIPKEELKARRAKSGYRIKANLAPGSPIGPITGTLRIKTDIPVDPDKPEKKSEFPIQLKGSRSGPLRLMPLPGTKYLPEAQALDLGEFDASKGKTARFMLLVQELPDKDFEITGVESDTPFLKVNLKRDEAFKAADRQKFELTFEAPPGCPKVSMLRSGAARITLKTNHPLNPEMKFRVELISQ